MFAVMEGVFVLGRVESVLELIGGTPMVKLRRVTEGLEANLFVKCEYLNPSGSIKDRMALKMIVGAEEKGRLRKGGTIVEMTSGNTGPALAFVGSIKEYRVRLFIPAQWTGTYDPENRIKIMRLFGADVSPVEKDEHKEFLQGLSANEAAAAIVALGMKKCHDLECKNNSFWWADQMCNMDNALAHKDGTGREIIEQLDGKIDAWVASIGTGGTLLGVAEALNDESIGAEVVGVEPEDAKVTEWIKKETFSYFSEKLGLPKRKPIVEVMLEKGIPDKLMTVSHDQARKMTNMLCREEGLFCGLSSGANVYAALKVAKKLGEGANVVTVLVDNRDRYFTEYPNEHYVI